MNNMPTIVQIRITTDPSYSPSVAQKEVRYQLSELGLSEDDCQKIEKGAGNVFYCYLK